MTSSENFIPYGCHWIDDDDIAAVSAALEPGNWLTQGPRVAEFEKKVAQRVQARHAIACSNGTAALHLALLALGVRRGDEIVAPAITFAATSNCGLYTGATPRFADIDYATMQVSIKSLASQLNSRTRAVLPVHFAGLPLEMARIQSLVKDLSPNAAIVEDACHALGAVYPDGAPVGCLRYADMAVFSFHPVKHIATGEGGMVVTDSDYLAERLRLFRSHGITKDPHVLQKPDEGPWYYEMQELGFNYRLPDLNCALGISQMDKLDAFVHRRRAIAARYHAAFADIEGVDLPPSGTESPNPERHLNSWHIYVLRVDFERLGKSRRDVVAQLAERGIGTQVHYYPVALQPYYRKRFGFSDGQFPMAERHYARALTIPLYPAMSDDDVERVIDAVGSVLTK